MKVNDYQAWIDGLPYGEGLVPFSSRDQDIIFTLMGLQEEVGELCQRLRKGIREGWSLNEQLRRPRVRKELGDVAWYLVKLVSLAGAKLADVLMENQRKIEDRRTRGVITGEGDER